MNNTDARRWQAVLFDLDGTLVDSAPDLAGAGNELRERRQLPPLPLDTYRPLTGTGARGMLGVALQVRPEHPDFEALKDEYLDAYAARLTQATGLFSGISELLATLEQRGLPWGIVTNKHSRFAEPLVEALGLASRSAVLICGDTAARAKPHPDPLLEACRRLNLDPGHCAYVGDDLRDIQAGQAAAMSTIAVEWGYLGDGEPVHRWGADHRISFPAELLKLPGLA
ncbi:phosphoglycolate phosphatase [Sphaerotilus hippei]|uniref:phosphoglycolate phosphatase n=1 Tax=Sphaerotilus hippei TaxID=744406 RepID=A0A318GU79_9BURK|nr:HAD-IA family hydrolase [Sphaerotilus hippei]PXW92249.1 phosphoglycolate phosphatase [Sphaerotilus hippei]